jgi:hypothetical protein
MNEGTGMRDGAGASEVAGMGAEDAAIIMSDARERARHELTVNRPAIFASWALVYLLGYGVVWLSVRGQRPFTRRRAGRSRCWPCSPWWPWVSPRS